ncbi:MAG: peptidylprolyl isomerase [candidate division Zixibacteria bacterium HGW-Zixibacteria-1]|nr:MAG: peptidylprolyl isomerase [candidate division Zixibacteria bacterium HGW-Zixibacteria-1]
MKYFVILLLSMTLVFSMVSAGEEQSKDTKGDKIVEKSEYTKRNADNPEVAIETDFGTMKLELFRDVAPIHVDSMLARIREGFYDGLIFHRVIDGFMIQGGDPKGNGTGGPGYSLPAEFSKLKHIEGTLSMARSQNPNSAGSQFFICLAPAQYLDGQYTIFGHLMDGYDTLHKIGKVQTGAQDRPLKDVFMRKVTILKDVTKEAGE